MACNSCNSCGNTYGYRTTNSNGIWFPDFVANSCCNPCCAAEVGGVSDECVNRVNGGGCVRPTGCGCHHHCGCVQNDSCGSVQGNNSCGCGSVQGNNSCGCGCNRCSG